MQTQSCWSSKELFNSIIKQLLLYQIVVLISLMILFTIFLGFRAGYSAFLGGIAWFLPSYYFARKVFAAVIRNESNKMVKSFYLAEIYKFLLSAFLIILIIKSLSIVAIPFISGYIVALISYWIISIFVVMRKRL